MSKRTKWYKGCTRLVVKRQRCLNRLNLWRFTLECGHVVERHSADGSIWPKRCYCEICKESNEILEDILYRKEKEENV